MKVFVAGHNGMVGAALCRKLENAPGVTVLTKARSELNLLNQSAVLEYLNATKPDQIYLAAAKVGGIRANNEYPADFIYQNLAIQNNVIHGAYLAGIEKLMFLGSSCIYPKLAQQPMAESALLTGQLEPTNEPYAIAKIAGIKLCESYNRQHGTDFRAVMPTNLYGPGDNFHPENSHVIPALIRRFHEAATSKADSISIWGSGTPRREFLHVDDMAFACIHMMQLPTKTIQQYCPTMQSHINIGCGEDIAIADLAKLIAQTTHFQGELLFDSNKPDGAPQKLLDTQLAKQLGWQPTISLQDGLRSTYAWYLAEQNHVRR